MSSQQLPEKDENPFVTSKHDHQPDRKVVVAVRVRPRLEKANHPERYDATCVFKTQSTEAPDASPQQTQPSSPDKDFPVSNTGMMMGGGKNNIGAEKDSSTPSSPHHGTTDKGGEKGQQQCVYIVNPETKESHQFAYDAVLEPTDGQEAVFEQVVSAPLLDAMDGCDLTIVAYGQTGSGKTFTLLGEPAVTLSGEKHHPHHAHPQKSSGGNVPPMMSSNSNTASPTATGGGAGSEKTSSMARMLQPDSGVYLRIMDEIMKYREQRCKHTHVVIGLSVVEVYNDNIYDLLKQKQNVQYREVGEDLTLINQTQVRIDHHGHVQQYFDCAYKHRSVAQTIMNDESSRSHALFFIDVFQQMKTSDNPDPPDLLSLTENFLQYQQKMANEAKVGMNPQKLGMSDRILGPKSGDVTAAGVVPSSGSSLAITSGGWEKDGLSLQSNPSNDFNLYPVTRSRVTLMDLAGSERIKRSGVTGTQLSEALYVNKSLSALGHVVNHLCLGSKHIPFRDAKLTRILRSSFVSPRSKIVFVTTVSPTIGSFSETLGSLRFASRLKDIKPVASMAGNFVAFTVLEDQYLKKVRQFAELTSDMRLCSVASGYERQLRNSGHTPLHVGQNAAQLINLAVTSGQLPPGVGESSSEGKAGKSSRVSLNLGTGGGTGGAVGSPIASLLYQLTVGSIPSAPQVPFVRSTMVQYKHRNEKVIQQQEATSNAQFKAQVEGFKKELETPEYLEVQRQKEEKKIELTSQLRNFSDQATYELTEVDKLKQIQHSSVHQASTDSQDSMKQVANLHRQVLQLEKDLKLSHQTENTVSLELRNLLNVASTDRDLHAKELLEVERIVANEQIVGETVQLLLGAQSEKEEYFDSRNALSALRRLYVELSMQIAAPEEKTGKGGSIPGSPTSGSPPFPLSSYSAPLTLNDDVLSDTTQRRLEQALSCRSVSPLSLYFSPGKTRPVLFRAWKGYISPPPSPASEGEGGNADSSKEVEAELSVSFLNLSTGSGSPSSSPAPSGVGKVGGGGLHSRSNSFGQSNASSPLTKQHTAAAPQVRVPASVSSKQQSTAPSSKSSSTIAATTTSLEGMATNKKEGTGIATMTASSGSGTTVPLSATSTGKVKGAVVDVSSGSPLGPHDSTTTQQVSSESQQKTTSNNEEQQQMNNSNSKDPLIVPPSVVATTATSAVVEKKTTSSNAVTTDEKKDEKIVLNKNHTVPSSAAQEEVQDREEKEKQTKEKRAEEEKKQKQKVERGEQELRNAREVNYTACIEEIRLQLYQRLTRIYQDKKLMKKDLDEIFSILDDVPIRFSQKNTKAEEEEKTGSQKETERSKKNILDQSLFRFCQQQQFQNNDDDSAAADVDFVAASTEEEVVGGGGSVTNDKFSNGSTNNQTSKKNNTKNQHDVSISQMLTEASQLATAAAAIEKGGSTASSSSNTNNNNKTVIAEASSYVPMVRSLQVLTVILHGKKFSVVTNSNTTGGSEARLSSQPTTGQEASEGAEKAFKQWCYLAARKKYPHHQETKSNNGERNNKESSTAQKESLLLQPPDKEPQQGIVQFMQLLVTHRESFKSAM